MFSVGRIPDILTELNLLITTQHLMVGSVLSPGLYDELTWDSQQAGGGKLSLPEGGMFYG